MKKIEKLTASLPNPSSLKELKIIAAKFEKDDPTNFHIDFITACSNLRAMNYRIKMESKHQTKFIAGKIIPAIATTTAMVTGMVCMEWYKILQKLPIEKYRNSFCNLALPLFTESEPFAPMKTEIKLAGDKKGETLKFSSWDTIDVKLGNVTVKDFLKYWYKTYGHKVKNLGYGSTNLYMALQKSLKTVREMLKKPLVEVATSRSGEPLPKDADFIKLQVSVDNPDADENSSNAEKTLDFPPVRFFFK